MPVSEAVRHQIWLHLARVKNFKIQWCRDVSKDSDVNVTRWDMRGNTVQDSTSILGNEYEWMHGNKIQYNQIIWMQHFWIITYYDHTMILYDIMISLYCEIMIQWYHDITIYYDVMMSWCLLKMLLKILLISPLWTLHCRHHEISWQLEQARALILQSPRTAMDFRHSFRAISRTCFDWSFSCLALKANDVYNSECTLKPQSDCTITIHIQY